MRKKSEKIVELLNRKFENSGSEVRAKVEMIPKVNQMQESIVLAPEVVPEGKASQGIAFAVDDLPDDPEEAMDVIRDSFAGAKDRIVDLTRAVGDKDRLKAGLTRRLLNASWNEAVLKQALWRFSELDGLAEVLYCRFIYQNETCMAAVSREILNLLELSETEAFSLAERNDADNLRIESMGDMLASLAPGADSMIPDDGPKMLVVTNKQTNYGAAGVLLKKTKAELARIFDGDCMILPSSVHEVIVTIVPEDDLSSMAAMVSDINAEKVLKKDRLADCAYLYHTKTDRFERIG